MIPITAEIEPLEIPELLCKLHDEKVTVWCGFTVSTVIRPFFFEGMRDSGFETVSVTVEKYADILQDRNISNFSDKHTMESTTFMQDGALPYIARQMKDLFHRLFGDDRAQSCHFLYV